jgi:hypothetical protein
MGLFNKAHYEMVSKGVDEPPSPVGTHGVRPAQKHTATELPDETRKALIVLKMHNVFSPFSGLV